MNPVYSKGGGASSNMQAPKAKGKAKVAGNEKRDVSKETCFPWNDGKCSHGPCPNGRMHNCKLCGGNHRAPDCSKNKAKGKGKASSSNGGGNGGDDGTGNGGGAVNDNGQNNGDVNGGGSGDANVDGNGD